MWKIFIKRRVSVSGGGRVQDADGLVSLYSFKAGQGVDMQGYHEAFLTQVEAFVWLEANREQYEEYYILQVF